MSPDKTKTFPPDSTFYQPGSAKHKEVFIDGKSYEIIDQKIGFGERVFHLVKIIVFLAGNIFSLFWYFYNPLFKFQINQLFKEFFFGTREIKILTPFHPTPLKISKKKSPEYDIKGVDHSIKKSHDPSSPFIVPCKNLHSTIPTTTSHDPSVEPPSSLFPHSLNEIKFIAKLGGTTGAEKVEDGIKNVYAKKMTSEKLKRNHLLSEYFTNKAYKVLEVKVPEVALYEFSSKQHIKEGLEEKIETPVMLSKFVPEGAEDLYLIFRKYGLDTKNLSTSGLTISKEWKNKHSNLLNDIQNEVKKGFVADALLVNWDLAGLEFDNLKYDPITKEIWRIDNGSGLDHRARGEKKNVSDSEIIELKTLRQPHMNQNTSFLFETVTNEDVVNQIESILPKRDPFLAAIPSHLKTVMSKRFDCLPKYLEEAKKLPPKDIYSAVAFTAR